MSLIRRVVVGMSGGVDSAVAAALLQRRGLEVIGAFMKNWDDQDESGSCQLTQEADLQDARSVCDHLRIPLLEVNFVKEYWNEVFTRLLEDYERGFTPNPDVLCNKFIKFGAFYEHARRVLGADAIATGHYARSSWGDYLEQMGASPLAELRRAVDPRKDQTLFLSDIGQEPLQRTMFPLGSLCKTRVRQLARELGMEKVSRKRDSTGICFIGKKRFSHFIAKYLEDKPGPFIDVDTGKVLGEHQGVHQYTLGQRCGISGCRQAYYVARRDAESRVILAALGRDHPALYSSQIEVASPHWIAWQPELRPDTLFNCMFKFQHTEWTVPCSIYANNSTATAMIRLAFPTRALTPGQQAVFYRGDVCLGSAKILDSISLVNLKNVVRSHPNLPSHQQKKITASN